MKKIFTLLFVFLISVSLMGQVFTKKGSNFKLLKKSHRETTVEKIMHKKHDGMVFTGPKFNNRKTSEFKSVQLNKQKLDSAYSYSNYGNWKDEFIYDARGNNTQEIYYEWDDSTNWWVNYTKITFNYDNGGKDTMDMVFWWNIPKSQWDSVIRNEYFYDVQGKLIQSRNFWYIYQTKDKVDYTYDAQGNNTQEVDYRWNDSTNQWYNYYKHKYTYNTQGNNTQMIGYNWDDSTKRWDNYYKLEYTYDARGNNTQEIDYNWNNATSQWVGTSKIDYTYDTKGNNTQEIDYNWNNATSQWVGTSKIDFTYNNLYSFNELILPVDIWKTAHMITSVIYYDWNKSTNEWTKNEQDTLYYSAQNVTVIPQHKNRLNIGVYPNPAADYIIVDMKSSSSPALIELYDMVGRKVISQEIFGKQQISVRKLKSGIYICRITYRGKTQTTEIRKE